MSIALQYRTGMGAAFLSAPALREMGIDALRRFEMTGTGWGPFTRHPSPGGEASTLADPYLNVPVEGQLPRLNRRRLASR